MLGFIIGAAIAGTTTAIIANRQKKKMEEEQELQSMMQQSEYERQLSQVRQTRPQVIVQQRVVTKTKVVHSKKENFFDLYREMDNYLAGLLNQHNGGGVTYLIKGLRCRGQNGQMLQGLVACREYRNGISHKGTKWRNMPDPTKAAMKFLNGVYAEVRGNKEKYRKLLRAGYLAPSEPRQLQSGRRH